MILSEPFAADARPWAWMYRDLRRPDLLQLATDKVKIRIPKTKMTGTQIEDYYAGDVKEKYQVTPVEFIDMKALMGDASDNIPGVPGIGEKTAAKIISAYKNIETAYEHAAEIKPKKASQNLVEYWEQAKLSKVLATIAYPLSCRSVSGRNGCRQYVYAGGLFIV